MSRRRLVAPSLAVLLLALGVLSAQALAGGPAPAPASPPVALDAGTLLAEAARATPASKLRGGLAALAAAQPAAGSEQAVLVESRGPLDLGRYGARAHRFRWPAGEHVAVVRLRAADLAKVAALDGVIAIRPILGGSPAVRPEVPGRPAALPAALPAAELAARARAAAPWSAVADQAAGGGPALAPSGGAGPAGWWDVRDGHAAREAWELGFRGEGVTVAVLDDAVDFANYDLMDTWAVLPAGHPYAGWPQVFDTQAGALIAVDKTRPATSTLKSTRTAANGVIELYQSAPVTQREVDGAQRATGCFRPLVYVSATQARELGPERCDYILPETSLGGTVRFGHHPDTVLRGLGARAGQLGEWAGVIIVDEHGAGEFDTVYVDLDNDRDFSDEKPVTQASPLAWRDLSAPADGVPDLSAGLLYWIADGRLPLPAAWVWGLEADVPAAGTMVAFHYIQGSHGTLCASNILSQGRLKVRPDQILSFRDLPEGEPPSVNMGMAPKARLVSIGDVYIGAGSFEAGWRYAVFGHDKDRADDDIQVTSNSYGWSGTDNDNLDADSRLIDHYVRAYAPNTSFLFATGNGGPGYGTLAPPSPSAGVDVAASTQMGSTGYDSITDTTQITFGDIIPFSNRGPGAGGTTGPDLAADGAFASGGTPINGLGDGTRALGTWGGTSRSTPVAAGAMTLVYQAFRERAGRWPSFDEARALLMAGARFNGYGPLTAGAGVVDAADAVRIAAGRHGVYAQPAEWRAGDYQGAAHEAFPNIVRPGQTATRTLTLVNPSASPVTVRLSAARLRRLGSRPDSLTVDRTAESMPAGTVPDYLRTIDRSSIPAGTELLTVRGVYPYAEFDVDNNLAADNFFQIGVLQHTDIDGDDQLWVDRNGNGAVNYELLGDAYVDASTDGVTKTLDATQGGITVPLGPEGLAGPLAYYGLACNDTDGNPTPPEQDLREKIALIQRGTCTFNEKIVNAQKLGAVGAVVITDDRPRVTMGGDAAGIEVAGVMVDRQPGETLRDGLLGGKSVSVRLMARTRSKGIDGGSLVVFPNSEIDAYEYERFSDDSGVKNNWEISVHHPLERWADGIHLAFWHTGRSTAVTNTHLTLRYDFYGYQPWPAVTLSAGELSIPAGGQATVLASLAVPADAPPGALEGALFADYGRGAGDTPVAGPGGWELPGRRLVVPVIANVAADYGWQGAVTLGGAGARDADAPYDNGVVRGAFKWNWRPESGDWRFFFVDAAAPEAGESFWLFRSRWEDPVAGKADIDTRLFGPSADRFSDPDNPANAEDDWADPAWYGPYGLQLKARSPYLVAGSTWPFNTSSGGNEDWLAAPGAAGLHELMLHNVLFSGAQIEMPYETTVSSVRLNTARVQLFGDRCATLSVAPQIDLPGFVTGAVGLGVPERLLDQPIQQDDANNVGTASYRHDLALTENAVRLDIDLVGQATDDLDLFLLRDANNDGQFVYPDEVYATAANGPSATESIRLGATPAGRYQVWVHGFGVPAGSSTFDLTIVALAGDDLEVRGAPAEVKAGATAHFEVCARVAELGTEPGPLDGILTMGPGGAPTLFTLPVTWRRALPTIQLPLLLKDEPLR